MTIKPLVRTFGLSLGLSWGLILGLSFGLFLASAAVHPAWSHGGAKPMHGGVVQVAQDLSFELVVQADGATIYLSDHGKALASKGITGKLTVLQGTVKTDLPLQHDGDNRLRAQGLKLGKGDKLVAVLDNVAGKTVTVRFTVK